MSPSTDGESRPPCPLGEPDCHSSFSKGNDVARHLKEQHQPPKECPRPDCFYRSRRIGRIRTHAGAVHRRPLSHDELNTLETHQETLYQQLRREYGLDGTSGYSEGAALTHTLMTQQPGSPREAQAPIEIDQQPHVNQNTQGLEASSRDYVNTSNSVNETMIDFTTEPADNIYTSAYLQTHFHNDDILDIPPLEYTNAPQSNNQAVGESAVYESFVAHSLPSQDTPSGNNGNFPQGLHNPQLEYLYGVPAADNVAVNFQDNFYHNYTDHPHSWPEWLEDSPPANYNSTHDSSSR